MERDSFVFYRSFAEAIKTLDGDERIELENAIYDYALDGKQPDFQYKACRAVFPVVRAQLDASAKHYTDGKQGGRPSKSKRGVSETEKGGFQTSKGGFLNSKRGVFESENPGFEDAKGGLETSKTNDNVNVNVNDNVNVNANVNESVNVNGAVSGCETTVDAPAFEPPAERVCQAYIRIRSQATGMVPDFDAKKFISYYSARGWKSGSTQIMNWRALVDNWLERSAGDDTADPFE